MRFRMLGLLVSAMLVLGVVGSALAMESSRTISVIFRGISLVVNGRVIPVEQEPFVYEGRTYVPIRAVAEALGQDVSWDAESNQVRINGRVAVRDVSAEIVKPCCGDDRREAVARGIITNATDKKVLSIAAKCTATDSTGSPRIIYETLVGAIPPGGMTKFEVSLRFASEAAKVQSTVPVTCELLEVRYAEQ